MAFIASFSEGGYVHHPVTLRTWEENPPTLHGVHVWSDLDGPDPCRAAQTWMTTCQAIFSEIHPVKHQEWKNTVPPWLGLHFFRFEIISHFHRVRSPKCDLTLPFLPYNPFNLHGTWMFFSGYKDARTQGRRRIQVKLQSCRKSGSISFYFIKTHIRINIHPIIYTYSLHIYVMTCMVTFNRFHFKFATATKHIRTREFVPIAHA